MANIPGLKRGANGTYGLRKAVPRPLWDVLQKREIKQSYATSNFAEAKRKHALAWHLANEEIHQAWEALARRERGAALTVEQLDDLTASYFRDLDARLSTQLEQQPPEDIEEYRQSLRQEIDDFRVPTPDYRHVQHSAVQLLQSIHRDDLVGEPSFWPLCRRLNDAYLEALERQCHRVSGQREPARPLAWLGQRGRFEIPEAAFPRGVGANVASGSQMTLAAAWERFQSDPSRSATERSKSNAATAQRALLEVIGERTPFAEITRVDLVKVRDLLLRTPANCTARYPTLTLEAAAEREAQSDTPRTLSHKTVNNQLVWVAALFNWAEREQLVGSNPARGLQVHSENRTRTRGPWTVEELNSLFQHPLFTGCQDDERGWNTKGVKRPRRARFWVPLLCLFQGLRLNEACRLFVDDLSVDEGVWALRVAHNPERMQFVKTKTTASVPLHPKLVELGFPAFVESVGTVELFPEVPLDCDNVASKIFSKWFGRMRQAAGINRPGAVLHSFRHNFRDGLRRARVASDRADALGRWSIPRSVGERYGEGYRPADLVEDISRLEYPGLDLSHLLA